VLITVWLPVILHPVNEDVRSGLQIFSQNLIASSQF